MACFREHDELAISVITLRERLEGAERARQANAPSAPDIAADVEDLVHAYSGRILPINEDAAPAIARRRSVGAGVRFQGRR